LFQIQISFLASRQSKGRASQLSKSFELAGGTTIDDLLEAYPRLTREAIYAALAFAADTLRAEVVYPLDRAVS
jgi:hypothetical protein